MRVSACVLASASFSSILVVCTGFTKPPDQVNTNICDATLYCSTEKLSVLLLTSKFLPLLIIEMMFGVVGHVAFLSLVTLC